jgi:hypothetical protein
MTTRQLFGLFLLATCWAPCHAQEQGAYVGAALGRVDHRDGDDGRGFVFDDSATISRILGGYRVGRHFAVEGGWAETRSLHDTLSGPVAGPLSFVTDIATQYELLTAQGLAIFPFGRFSVFIGGGLYRSETTTALRDFAGRTLATLRERERGVVAAGGVGFEVDRFVLRAEVESFKNVNGTHVEDLTLGVVFLF